MVETRSRSASRARVATASVSGAGVACVVGCAFKAARQVRDNPRENIERVTRRLVGRELVRQQTIPAMIERIKALVAAETA